MWRWKKNFNLFTKEMPNTTIKRDSIQKGSLYYFFNIIWWTVVHRIGHRLGSRSFVFFSIPFELAARQRTCNALKIREFKIPHSHRVQYNVGTSPVPRLKIACKHLLSRVAKLAFNARLHFDVASMTKKICHFQPSAFGTYAPTTS